MSDTEDVQPEVGLANTRSRRSRSAKKANQFAALEALKASREKGKRDLDEAGEVENVYDVVDVDQYSELVSARQNDDWIVDDDGGYVEDGREIFDDEMGDEAIGHRSSSSKDAKGKKSKAKKKAEQNDSSESSSVPGKSIKNMILNMGGASKRKAKEDVNLEGDSVLGELLGEINSTTISGSAPASKRTNLSGNKAANAIGQHHTPDSHADGMMKRSKTGIKVLSAKKQPKIEQDVDHDGGEEAVQEDFQDCGDMFDDDMDVGGTGNDDQKAQSPVKSEATGKENKIKQEETFKANTEVTKIKKQVKEEAERRESLNTNEITACIAKQSSVTKAAEQTADSETLKKLISGNSLRMFWLDAHEDPFKNPGTIWLFGKVFVESTRSYVSCCVTVKNIERKCYLLKRDKNLKTGEDVDIMACYKEFNDKLSPRYKIGEFKSRPVNMRYAFEHEDVPEEAQYLEIVYSPKFPALPSALTGDTFSRAFATNQSCLERFLMERKIKGPSWIDIKLPKCSNPPSSWCKVEAICEDMDNISVVAKDIPASPPVTILALNMKTVVNPKSHQNEIALVSGLSHSSFYLDRPAPSPPYTEHFCALTRPSDEVWPFDFQKALAQNNARNAKIDKMDSERALLGFLLAKIGKLDPDIIIGHDIFGFDVEVLLHRIVQNKIPQWSRLGRLRRSQPPQNRGRGVERQAVTGRLICDLKISAKELIRCKSYDLGALIEKLLGKQLDKRVELDLEEVRKAYSSSKALLQVTASSLQDTADTLQCICELNALPLALQITQVAGNVMSRTLLGGRAERNEFLLLHAFYERGYIVPDKQYGKKANKGNSEAEGDEGAEAGGAGGKAGGRRKPAYAGGLVLEPKKGFYDNFILLMDFNSLYPSIIQEYNICFTTVDRKRPQGVSEEDYIPDLPESGAEAGVLPTEIRKLVDSRRAVKNLLKDPGLTEDQRLQYDIRQKALKLTANSMYGCLGFSFSRFYAKPLAALVTSRGREILLQTKSLVEKMNLEVIYGDTDSIMINSNSIDYDEVFKLGAQIKAAVNKTYKLLELDIDGVYRYMLLLKKKKYAAVPMERKPDGQLVTTTELKGLDIVRRDWCQLAANAGKQILNKILSDCAADDRISYIHDSLKNIAEDLKEGKIGLADLAITKSLTKDPSDYPDKKSLPHVQVALRVNSKGGKKLRAGDTVEYIICQDGSQLAATQRAYHVNEVKESETLKVDYQYYLAQQLHPVVSRLCDPLDGTDSSRIAGCLGLDPEQYRRAIRTENHQDDEAAIKDEDRFRQCEKFSIDCECGEKIVVDSITRGSGNDEVLALLHCPKPGCKKNPILERTAFIQNKLTMAIREHIKNYYAGWVVCEDPGCSGRTRRLPLTFQRAFPICNTCYKATMYREYTDSQLYTQLLYYQHLFSLRKLQDRKGSKEFERLSNMKQGAAAVHDDLQPHQ